MKKIIKQKNFNNIARLFLAVIFFLSGFFKLHDSSKAVNLVIFLLPNLTPHAYSLIRILAVAELTISFNLALKNFYKPTLYMAITLFSIFLLLSIYGWLVNINLDCGCFGSFIHNKFGFLMTIRNVFFFTMCLYLCYYESMFQSRYHQ